MGEQLELELQLTVALDAMDELAKCLREAHRQELETNHQGDGAAGCSYCAAIRRAAELRAETRGGSAPIAAETPDAMFVRIAAEIKGNADWRRLLAGDDDLNALEQIAAHYEGKTLDTGGHCIVALVSLGEHDCMGVTGEVICHYRNSKATSVEDIFWEPENEPNEGAVSLLDDEGGRYGDDY